MGGSKLKLRNKTNQPKALRAIYPNEGVTAWYAQVLREVLQQAVNDAVVLIGAAYPEPAIASIVAQDAHYGVWVPSIGDYVLAADAAPSVNRIDKALKAWGKKWQGKFDKLSATMARKFATRSFSVTDVALRTALRDAGFTVSFKPTKKVLESYKLVVAENVGLIRNLQQTLYNKIQQDVWSSVRAGGDMAALSVKLHNSYGIEAKRAALIARDQNNKAKAVIESSRRQELGLRQAIWQHSGGGKEPRPVHLAWGREGKVFDLDKGLYDPDEGQWIFPGQLIKCRCTSRAIIPGFDE